MNNLTQQRPLFFSIGLVLSCLMVVTAFEWKVYQKHEVIDLEEWSSNCMGDGLIYPGEVVEKKGIEQNEHYKLQEFVEKEGLIPTITIPPAPPPPPLVPTTVEATCQGYEKEPKEDFICLYPVEEAARPKEGYKAFYKFLLDNFQYPALVAKIGVEGKVFIRFVVTKDGGLTQFEVLKGTDTVLDDEVIRVLKMAPKWIPAKRNGLPIKSHRTIPMYIHLQK